MVIMSSLPLMSKYHQLAYAIPESFYILYEH